MGIYKKGQGKIVRLCAFISSLLLVLLGCYELYKLPSLKSWWWQDILIPKADRTYSWFERLGAGVKPILILAIGVFIVATYLLFLVFNKPKVADFLIETEGEMRKVSWPKRKEYWTASVVVIVLIIVISLFLFAVDRGLSALLHSWGIGF